MASKHEVIVQAVQSDFSVQRKGRLFKMMQGTFRALHSEAIIRVSPYPAKNDGYPDLTGFEYMPYSYFENHQYKEKRVPVYCLCEVKTYAYPKLSEGQIDHLNYCVQIGGRAYVARESDRGYDLIEWGHVKS